MTITPNKLRRWAAGCEQLGRWCELDGSAVEPVDPAIPSNEDVVPPGYYDEVHNIPCAGHKLYVEGDDPLLDAAIDVRAPPEPERLRNYSLSSRHALAINEQGELVWLAPVEWQPYDLSDQNDQLENIAVDLRNIADELAKLRLALGLNPDDDQPLQE